ncbi:aminoacyl-tRNA hydrolase, partial [Francisella tularensis subsp. holarctica]|nr:aminoacyl-tRNA hydrolase [Francisella tularensis subsp. holarctica]
IVGLGNIGKEYQDTRHKVGECFIAKIAQDNNQSFSSNTKLNCNLSKVSIDYNNVVLVFPTTYMNNSVLAVRKVANFYKIAPEDILVEHN